MGQEVTLENRASWSKVWWGMSFWKRFSLHQRLGERRSCRYRNKAHWLCGDKRSQCRLEGQLHAGLSLQRLEFWWFWWAFLHVFFPLLIKAYLTWVLSTLSSCGQEDPQFACDHSGRTTCCPASLPSRPW